MRKKHIVILISILIAIIAIISNIVDDGLDGKTIAFLGDSLIEGHGNDSKSFDYYFSDIFKTKTGLSPLLYRKEQTQKNEK